MSVEFTTIWTPDYAELLLGGYARKPVIHYYTWDNARAELLKVVQSQSGADVSIIGDTWISSFIGMNALRPFTTAEVARLGGADAFLPPFWQMGTTPDDPSRVWSIPTTAGSRYILYRQDILEQAGIDPQTAFLTPAALEHTLEQLRLAGVRIPYVVAPRGGDLFFKVAAWWRSMGGDYFDHTSRRVIFHSPQAKAGLASFFRLYRYLIPEVIQDNEQFFMRGEAAVALSGFWLYDLCRHHCPPEAFTQVRLAPPPGIPFVGGAHLVIWKHTTRDAEAFDLVRHLCSSESNLIEFQHTGNYAIPSRMELLNAPPFNTEPIFRAIRQTLINGRGFWAWPLGSLIQERLTNMLDRLAQDVLEQPGMDVAELVNKHVEPLARTINRTLSAQG